MAGHPGDQVPISVRVAAEADEFPIIYAELVPEAGQVIVLVLPFISRVIP